jgi:2',3'-cyclic-nucleotide 2'-phosphodiesterase (5'-nucleotidase family)
VRHLFQFERSHLAELGNLTLGNILEILPFGDMVVVIEVDGQAIWNAMESALSGYPADEG